MQKKNFTVRLSDDLRARLKAIAQRERRSEAWMVEEAVRQLCEREEAKQG